MWQGFYVNHELIRIVMFSRLLFKCVLFSLHFVEDPQDNIGQVVLHDVPLEHQL